MTLFEKTEITCRVLGLKKSARMSEMLKKENQEKVEMMWGRKAMNWNRSKILIISAGCRGS